MANVFDKKRVNTLPPLHSYDLKIDLQPQAEIPFGHIYFLSEHELQVLWDYLFVHPSTPGRGPIFFVAKKDGSFYPCVDY